LHRIDLDQIKMVLSDLKKGESGVIQSIEDFDIEIKLMDMGCFIGSEVVIELQAPLYDPIAIRIGQNLICIGKEEASKIVLS